MQFSCIFPRNIIVTLNRPVLLIQFIFIKDDKAYYNLVYFNVVMIAKYSMKILKHKSQFDSCMKKLLAESTEV